MIHGRAVGSTPQTINPIASRLNGVIRGAETGLAGTVESMAIAAVPQLGWPIVRWIWEALLEWVLSLAAQAVQQGATFEVIDVQVGHEQTALARALAQLIAAQKTGDPNAILAARKAFAEAHASLSHDDGSALPQ